jgi:MFS family permease
MRLLSRDGNYRGLLGVRALMRINVLTLVFYVPYGVERLGAVGLAGVFIGCIAASRLLASPLWAAVSHRWGNRRVLLLVAVLFTISPACALLAPRLPEAFSANVPMIPGAFDLPLCMYLLALAIVGAALAGNIVGTNAFMLESAPSRRRASYIAFLNTVTFPLAFSSMLAGLVLSFLSRLRLPLLLLGSRSPLPEFAPKVLGMEVLLCICIVAGIATLLATTRLRDVRGDRDAGRASGPSSRGRSMISHCPFRSMVCMVAPGVRVSGVECRGAGHFSLRVVAGQEMQPQPHHDHSCRRGSRPVSGS